MPPETIRVTTEQYESFHAQIAYWRGEADRQRAQHALTQAALRKTIAQRDRLLLKLATREQEAARA